MIFPEGMGDYNLLIKFFKFGIVGVSGTAVDFGVTYLLKERGRLNKYFANSCGFMVAVSTNYFFNRIFTFESHGEVTTQYLKFVSIGIIGMAMNNYFIYLFDKKFGFNFYFSKLLATFIVMIWNFGANLLFTFNQ
jgi:putative flippase GtrA